MLLFLLIIIPLLGGFLSWTSEYYSIKFPRWVALITVSIVLIISLYIWTSNIHNFYYQTSYSHWIVEFIYPWIPRFGIFFHLAIDGFSLLMVILSSILSIISVLCSWNLYKQRYQGIFFLSLLHIFSATLGIFLSIDLFLFFCFWEVILIPIYLLIIFFDSKDHEKNNRISAANTFFMYSQLSSFIMLLVIIGLSILYYLKFNIWTFDYNLLIKLYNENADFSVLEYILMIGFFIGFAIKIPIVPFQGWLPNVHRYLPMIGSIDIIGFLLKTGIYGILRFVIPFFPNSSHNVSNFFIFLGIMNFFYGAFLAFSQKDLKNLISYGSISHVGIILVAIYTYNKISYQGAILYIISHALSTSALFIVSGLIKKHFYTRNIYKINGLLEKVGWLPGFFLFFCLSTIGLPGTGSFIGELMILIGVFNRNPIFFGILIIGLICSISYTLKMMQNVCYGNYNNISKNISISIIDILVMLIILISLFFVGLNSKIIIDTLYLTKSFI
ncbi:complex I subunit 4 family protein [Buchnera aphidicola]|uniref:complex I subunit 4 family protein n=1 Tax=Buchnera aphidicola TaxID=9 RepID=UPI0031B713A7